MEFLQVKERDIIYILLDDQAELPQSAQAVAHAQAKQDVQVERDDLISQLVSLSAMQAREKSAHEAVVETLQAQASTLKASKSAAEAAIASLEYVTDGSPGILRAKYGSRFTYTFNI